MFENFSRNLSNVPGFRTNRKIVVLESDDWGSIRMPSKQVCDILVSEGIAVNENFFTDNDGLETNGDLEALFSVLASVKDKHGRSAVMTPLVIMGNPNFEAIRENGFTQYVFEPFTSTCSKYENSDRLLALWKEGLDNHVFVPEFHGREHLNVNRWMKGLEKKLPSTMRTFDLALTGLHVHMANEERGDYQAAFDIDELSELDYLKDVLTEGIALFKDLLGYQARYFVPTNGPFNTGLETHLKNLGIDFINAAKIQIEPIGAGKTKKRFHYLGQESKSKLVYLTRNVIFEPSKPNYSSWVDSAMKEIEIAFRWKKPAILSSHRVNYVSRIHESNRDKGLKDLHHLLISITKKWPDVEFFTSAELGQLMQK
ncbi:MAG: hypothetical protein P8O16_17325 [Algoriphagus sp.]|uniref:hypothetical protein n=1 Tax=Algoriphagus sp. TaxID=1872435 RepID=UPI0026154C9A|nr:hypothetical protein [Algoriphagus sp.]MDG1279044.1 hypothetical protein [Algoriphagus sp.]